MCISKKLSYDLYILVDVLVFFRNTQKKKSYMFYSAFHERASMIYLYLMKTKSNILDVSSETEYTTCFYD